MPIISFSTLKAELMNGKKKQTIRPKITSYWLRFKKGNYIFGYWKVRVPKEGKFLFASRLIEDPFVVFWAEFTDELMQRDGFDSLEQANKDWFIPNYGLHGKIISDKEFVVLRWGIEKMIFEETDKPMIKYINSNLLRAERAEKDISKLEYLTKVVNDATIFSVILENRGDFRHSREYIETAIDANKIIENILLNILSQKS